ncbi:MAG: hypothetical protein ACRDVL_09250 [Acidimicrobiia bacterium]
MLRRITILFIVVSTALALVAGPALGKSMFIYKESSRAVQTDWIQVDGTDPGSSPLGNVHIGFLYAYEISSGRADAFAFIDDFDCEPGKLPDGGGHGFEEEEPSGCVYVGSRIADGYGLEITMDRKLTQATLKGQMTVYGGGHGDGGPIGFPMANITWTGAGPLTKQSSTWRYDDGTTTFSDRYRSTDRAAVMSGTLGPMGFDPNLSGGQMSDFNAMSKSKTG